MTNSPTKTTQAIVRIRHYLAMRGAKPIRHASDIIHGIHTGTQWEAEILLSDLRLVTEAVDAT